MWVDSSGGFVSWVVLAGDIPCVNGALPGFQDGVNASKDNVCLFVSTTAFPPSLNDSLVVPINLEVRAAVTG